MTDSEIIELLENRDSDAIVELENRYGSYCFTIANNILGSKEDADECMNDTWFQAWNAIPPQRPNKMSAFLGRITRNLAFDRYKMRNAKKRGGGSIELALEELQECIPSIEDTVQAAQYNELERLINQFLYSLPLDECNIFIRRYWHVESYKQISKRYNKKESNIKASLYRTRIKLKAYLEREGIYL